MPGAGSLAARLDALLPQTQCRQCGFAGCLAYARAMAAGEAPANRCATGGAAGIAALSAELGAPALPLDPEYGREAPFAVARIDPRRCIGCRFCAAACPVDAVTGAPKALFAVIEPLCTGCGLCVAACPMDCIGMPEAGRAWTREDADRSRARYEAGLARRAAAARALDARRAGAGGRAAIGGVMALVAARRRKA
ncbi:MAG: RnfABCDGE type electron transport complex subunit B [Duodenibacillus sp.]|nr:RnfABCDGE type electron transport complex subunit B [Duodenibacillus sp.]